jgi:hypothetical protein
MRRLLLFVCLVGASVAGMAPSASAHVHETFGDLTVGLGWREEPTYAGLANAVELTAVDGQGVAVDDPNAALTTTISFGDATVVRPLLPLDEPGAFGAEIVPTQPGTYTLHIEGTLAGETIDVTSTCSDTTFECVAAATEVEFPSREAVAVGAVAEDEDEGSAATVLAIAALTLSVVAVAVAVTVSLRSRRSGRVA